MKVKQSLVWVDEAGKKGGLAINGDKTKYLALDTSQVSRIVESFIFGPLPMSQMI